MERNAAAKHRKENCSTCMQSWCSRQRKSDHRKSIDVGPGQYILNIEKDQPQFNSCACGTKLYTDQPQCGSGCMPCRSFSLPFLGHMRKQALWADSFFPLKTQVHETFHRIGKDAFLCTERGSCGDSIGICFPWFSYVPNRA